MINLVILRISCVSMFSKFCFIHSISLMFNRSSVGMLVYMFEMSSGAILKFGTKRICDKSFIS